MRWTRQSPAGLPLPGENLVEVQASCCRTLQCMVANTDLHMWHALPTRMPGLPWPRDPLSGQQVLWMFVLCLVLQGSCRARAAQAAGACREGLQVRATKHHKTAVLCVSPSAAAGTLLCWCAADGSKSSAPRLRSCSAITVAHRHNVLLSSLALGLVLALAASCCR